MQTSEIDTYPEPEHGPEGMGLAIVLLGMIALWVILGAFVLGQYSASMHACSADRETCVAQRLP